MVPMPESYSSIMRKKGLLAETLYMLPEKPVKGTSWFEEANIRSFATSRGVFQLEYVLKSFARPTDDHRYIVFIITKSGIFTSAYSMCAQNEPIDFNTMQVKHFCDIEPKMLITLRPKTREIMIISNYRYTERIDGIGYPNTIHPDAKNCNKHDILVESDNTNPIICDYDENLYKALSKGLPYIWVRSDNYVDINNVIFCTQPY